MTLRLVKIQYDGGEKEPCCEARNTDIDNEECCIEIQPTEVPNFMFHVGHLRDVTAHGSI
jgi:hypothetical protein